MAPQVNNMQRNINIEYVYVHVVIISLCSPIYCYAMPTRGARRKAAKQRVAKIPRAAEAQKEAHLPDSGVGDWEANRKSGNRRRSKYIPAKHVSRLNMGAICACSAQK